MKVLNVITYSRYGGPQKRVLAISEELKERGVETIVYMPIDQHGVFSNKLDAKGIKYISEFFPILQKNKQALLLWVLYLPILTLRFCHIIVRERIDIVHVNGITNFLPVVAATFFNRPVIWHVNDMLTPKWIFNILVNPFLKIKSNLFLAASSQMVEDFFKTSSSQKWFELPPILHIDQGDSLQVRRDADLELRSNLSISKESIVIGYVGSIIREKGVFDFLEVAESLLKINSKLNFVIVGSEVKSKPKDFEEFKQRIDNIEHSDRIFCVGYQENVDQWLSMFDVFLMTSHSESGPMTYLEGLYSGVPIVATSVGLVPNNSNGYSVYLVDPMDTDAMIKGVNELLNQSIDKQRKKIQKDKVLEKFSASNVALLYESVYKQVIRV